MELNDLKPNEGSTHRRKRVCRGPGSGLGKTGGRGIKGQKSRSGVAIKGYEGGQMPLYQRLPKRGFRNTAFAKRYSVVNLGQIQSFIDRGVLDAGKPIDEAAMVTCGLVRRVSDDGVRVLGKGELTSKVDLSVAGASKSAVDAVEGKGGTVTVTAKTSSDRVATVKARGTAADPAISRKALAAEKMGAVAAAPVKKTKKTATAESAPVEMSADEAEAMRLLESGDFEATDANRPAAFLSDAPTDGDDLREINGVGPKLEGLLHENGVYYFKQIAELGATDIAWLDSRLSFKGRIVRDQWVAQAKKLVSER